MGEPWSDDRIDWSAVGECREKGDDPPECIRCGDSYSVDRDDAEVGTLCDPCAQTLVQIAASKIAAIRAELAAEHARPRPRVEWDDDSDALVCCGRRLGLWDVVFDARGYDSGRWWWVWGRSRRVEVATEAEARAALVAAAEAAGFDVSECKPGGEVSEVDP